MNGNPNPGFSLFWLLFATAAVSCSMLLLLSGRRFGVAILRENEFQDSKKDAIGETAVATRKRRDIAKREAAGFIDKEKDLPSYCRVPLDPNATTSSGGGGIDGRLEHNSSIHSAR